MTDEQAEELLNKLKQEFGDKIPNPEYYPSSFMYYVKLYKYLNDKPKNNS